MILIYILTLFLCFIISTFQILIDCYFVIIPKLMCPLIFNICVKSMMRSRIVYIFIQSSKFSNSLNELLCRIKENIILRLKYISWWILYHHLFFSYVWKKYWIFLFELLIQISRNAFRNKRTIVKSQSC